MTRELLIFLSIIALMACQNLPPNYYIGSKTIIGYSK